ncbi:ubiquitin-related modifier 1 [Kalaharituber pfeilii]|nr:ubiquitin-related modifier 1 [Kalaharituber pfeilii]
MFSNKTSHAIILPSEMPDSNKPTNVKYSLKYLYGQLITDTTKNLFVLDETIRPGVVALINDADWELVAEDEYVLQHGDYLFVSTLHGG